MIKTGKKEKHTNPVKSLTVEKITYVSPNQEKTRIMFNGKIDDVILVYGLTYVELIKDGKEIHFISLPTRKNTNGEYFNVCYAYIPAEIVENVREQIEKLLGE